MNNNLFVEIIDKQKILVKKGVAKILSKAYDEKTHYMLFDKFKTMGMNECYIIYYLDCLLPLDKAIYKSLEFQVGGIGENNYSIPRQKMILEIYTIISNNYNILL